jgi:hypothetical protein
MTLDDGYHITPTEQATKRKDILVALAAPQRPPSSFPPPARSSTRTTHNNRHGLPSPAALLPFYAPPCSTPCHLPIRLSPTPCTLVASHPRTYDPYDTARKGYRLVPPQPAVRVVLCGTPPSFGCTSAFVKQYLVYF